MEHATRDDSNDLLSPCSYFISITTQQRQQKQCAMTWEVVHAAARFTQQQDLFLP
jgi:hypothetical protein